MSPGVPRVELAPGYSIARVIHGGWQLSQGHRPKAIDADAVLESLWRLADAGFTTFDGADIYTGVEELFGRFLARRRRQGLDDVQVHTKLVPDADALATVSKRYVEGIVDRSLCRLGLERLDLVQLHWWDYAVPGYVETALWLDELRRTGKIRLLGATNFDTEHLGEILDAGVELASHQVQYSLLDRRPERGMAELCARHGVFLLCYGSLAGGFLGERHLDRAAPAEPLANRSLVKYRLIIDEFGGWQSFQELLTAARDVADKHGVSISNVAARWVLEQRQVGAVIVGLSATADRLASNLRLFDFELDLVDRERLGAVLRRHPGPEGDIYALERVAGGRHAAIMRTNLNRS